MGDDILGRQFSEPKLFDDREYRVPRHKRVQPSTTDPLSPRFEGRKSFSAPQEARNAVRPDEHGDYEVDTPTDLLAMYENRGSHAMPGLGLPSGHEQGFPDARGRFLRNHPDTDWDSQAWKQAPIRETDFSTGEDARLWQDVVTTDGVQHYMNAFQYEDAPFISDWDSKYDIGEVEDMADDEYAVDQFPRAISYGDRTDVLNGNHRIAAAALTGHGSMPMRVMDMNKRAEQGFQGSFWARPSTGEFEHEMEFDEPITYATEADYRPIDEPGRISYDYFR